MPTSKIQTGIRVDEIMLKKLRYIAMKQKRSLNSLAEYIFDREINSFETENGHIPLDSKVDSEVDSKVDSEVDSEGDS